MVYDYGDKPDCIPTSQKNPMSPENATPTEYSQNFDSLVHLIATELKENNPKAREQIRKIIEVAGIDFAQSLLRETVEIESSDGILLPDGTRRRTMGGVFLFLAKQKLTPEQNAVIFTGMVEKAQEKKVAETTASDEYAGKESEASQQPPALVEPDREARRQARNFARRLSDTDAERLEAMARLVQVGGSNLAQEVFETTLDMEAQGGLRKKDGTRRSPGGAFLYIFSRRLTEEQRCMVWPELPTELAPPVQGIQKKPVVNRPELRPVALAGIATTTKITLVGRPIECKHYSGFVTFRMESNRAPGLPKGLPVPTAKTSYLIYVADRQWAKVAAVLESPAATLVVEGYPVFDEKEAGICVFAMNVSGKVS